MLRWSCSIADLTLLVVFGRLDNMTGSGVHLNPQGIHFDQRVIALGKVHVTDTLAS